MAGFQQEFELKLIQNSRRKLKIGPSFLLPIVAHEPISKAIQLTSLHTIFEKAEQGTLKNEKNMLIFKADTQATMRTKLILSILAFSVFSLHSLAQSPNEKEETLLTNMIQGVFEDIFTQLNAEKIPDYFTGDFMLIENGEIWNNDSTRNYVEKAKARTPQVKRENRFDFFSIEVKENIAWVSYHNYATFTSENSPARKIHWLETVIAVKTPEGWRIRLLHNSPGKD